jgi:hypothetical protein
VFRNIIIFLRFRVVSTSSNPQAGGPPLVGCPRLHIRSYPPYLEAVPPSATRGRAMPWWQGPTNHGTCIITKRITPVSYKASESIGCESGWTREPVYTRWRRERSEFSPRTGTRFVGLQDRSLFRIPASYSGSDRLVKTHYRACAYHNEFERNVASSVDPVTCRQTNGRTWRS